MLCRTCLGLGDGCTDTVLHGRRVDVLDGRVLLAHHDHHLQVLLLCHHLALQLQAPRDEHLSG